MLATQPTDVVPFDLQRMFLGDMPWMFTLEIVFRTAFIYAFTLGMIRLVSRRSVAQLSLIEFFLVIALGSAVGDPMFYPQVPLLHAMLVVIVVVLLSRTVTLLINTSEVVERVLDGEPQRVVADGLIDVDGLVNAQLNREQLFELLRMEGVRHLGEVEQAYFEQRGTLSVFLAPQPKPGMRTVPPWDLEPPEQFHAGKPLEAARQLACERCGNVGEFAEGAVLGECPNCGSDVWSDAVLPRRDDAVRPAHRPH